jgi:threonine/homoserine/homoserine lactone efflux protein
MFPHEPSLFLFIAGSLLLLVITGPAVFYVLSRSVGQGRAAGVVSAAGITVGTLCHVAAAVLGLSALLVSSVRAFQTIKLVGAAYLVFLGVRMLISRTNETTLAAENTHSYRRIFAQAVLVNILNPKTALFFLAFLPQFVEPARGHIPAQIFSLGVLFALMGMISDSSWALVAGTLAAKLKNNFRWRLTQKNISGGALIALGLATAFSGAKTK